MSILRVLCSATRMHCRRNVDERPPCHLTLTSTHLLDHVGAELLHRQRADVPGELPDNRIAEAVVVQVQDVLNDLRPASVSERRRKLQLRRETCTHIVAVRILNERECVVRDLVDELDALVLRCMVDATLQHAATVAVGGDFDAVGRDGIVDELSIPARRELLIRYHISLRSGQAYLVVLGRKLVQTLLDHVVAVQILDEHDDVQAQSKDDGMDLHVAAEVSLKDPHRKWHKRVDWSDTCLPASRQEVDHLLDRAGAVHVQRDVDEFLCDGLADDVPLLVRRVLKQLLAEVVPEGI